MQHIHEAPLAPDGWARALPSIAATVRSEHGILLVQNTSRTIEFAVGFEMSSEQVAGFAATTSADPAFWGAIRGLPIGRVAPTSALIPDREFARTIFYNEGVRPAGAFHGLCVSPLRTPQLFVHLSTGRRLGRQDFRADDIAAMRTLVPHLVTALHVAHVTAPGGSMEIPGAGRSRPLRVGVAPFRAEAAQIDTAWLGAERPVAILLITDPERGKRARKEDLRLRFGLTPAEADVALKNTQGRRPPSSRCPARHRGHHSHGASQPHLRKDRSASSG